MEELLQSGDYLLVTNPKLILTLTGLNVVIFFCGFMTAEIVRYLRERYETRRDKKSLRNLKSQGSKSKSSRAKRNKKRC